MLVFLLITAFSIFHVLLMFPFASVNNILFLQFSILRLICFCKFCIFLQRYVIVSKGIVYIIYFFYDMHSLSH